MRKMSTLRKRCSATQGRERGEPHSQTSMSTMSLRWLPHRFSNSLLNWSLSPALDEVPLAVQWNYSLLVACLHIHSALCTSFSIIFPSQHAPVTHGLSMHPKLCLYSVNFFLSKTIIYKSWFAQTICSLALVVKKPKKTQKLHKTTHSDKIWGLVLTCRESCIFSGDLEDLVWKLGDWTSKRGGSSFFFSKERKAIPHRA